MTSLANEEPLYRLRHIYAGHETMRTPAMLALGLREVELPSMTSLASTQTFTPSSDSPHAWKRDPRPCLVTSHNLDKTGRYVYHICAMSTFGGEKLKADLAEIYQHFVIAVSPNQLDPDGPRIQTTPAWKAPGQWIMAYPYATKLLSDEWADPGTGVTGFHLSESMFDILEYEIGARYRELRKRMRNGGVRKHLQEDLKRSLATEYAKRNQIALGRSASKDKDIGLTRSSDRVPPGARTSTSLSSGSQGRLYPIINLSQDDRDPNGMESTEQVNAEPGWTVVPARRKSVQVVPSLSPVTVHARRSSAPQLASSQVTPNTAWSNRSVAQKKMTFMGASSPSMSAASPMQHKFASGSNSGVQPPTNVGVHTNEDPWKTVLGKGKGKGKVLATASASLSENAPSETKAETAGSRSGGKSRLKNLTNPFTHMNLKKTVLK